MRNAFCISLSRHAAPLSIVRGGGSISAAAVMGQVQFARRPWLRRFARVAPSVPERDRCRQYFPEFPAKKTRVELLLTRRIELPIVRPPFGKSTDFLESIPSKLLIFFKVHPRPVLSTSFLRSTTGKDCRYSPAVNLRPLR